MIKKYIRIKGLEFKVFKCKTILLNLLTIKNFLIKIKILLA